MTPSLGKRTWPKATLDSLGNVSPLTLSSVMEKAASFWLTLGTSPTGTYLAAWWRRTSRLTSRREVAEELGIDVRAGELLCIDWVAPHGPWDDLLAFIFDGGELDGTRASAIQLLDGELNAAEFCTEAQARQRLRPYVWPGSPRRLTR